MHSQLSIRKQSVFQAKPCFPKGHGRADPGQAGREEKHSGQGSSRSTRALLSLLKAFPLKAVRAKREWPIQVPNPEGLFGISFLISRRQILALCATQWRWFQSQAVPLMLFSQTSTITQARGVHTTNLSLKLNNFKKKNSLSKPLHFGLKSSKQTKKSVAYLHKLH